MPTGPTYNRNMWYVTVHLLVVLSSCGKPEEQEMQVNSPSGQPVVVPKDYSVWYTPKMTGLRNWAKASFANSHSGSYDTVTYGHMLEVTVINDTAISFLGDTFSFVSGTITPMGYIVETDTASILSFWDSSYKPYPRGVKMLSYYYRADSIAYLHHWDALGGSTSEKYYTE